MFKKAWMLGLLTALLSSCSDSSSGSSATRCVQGKIEPCPCAGSELLGTQTCLADGGFSACLGCPEAPEGGVGGQNTGGKGTGGKAGSAGKGTAGTGFLGGQGGQEQGGEAGQEQGGEAGQEQGGEAGTGFLGGLGGNGGGGNGGQGNQGGVSGGSGGSAPVDDGDKDGWTKAQGDCNDADPNVNPGAAEVVDVDSQGTPLKTQVDNDCDGKKADPAAPVACDAGLGPSVGDPFDAARAMGLCAVKVDEASKKWGVIGAELSDIAGPFLEAPVKQTAAQIALSYGILPGFGQTSAPREGERLLALSSGVARATGQAGAPADTCSIGQGKGYTSGYPAGFPKADSCGTPGTPNDGVALDLRIRVPSNARAMRFKYRFFSCEYPQYTCDAYNDVFAVLMSPSPLPAGDPMSDSSNSSANVVFEQTGALKNVIGVNNKTFLSACEPSTTATGYTNCKTGNGAQLAGSGFEGHAGSSWLVNQVPVPPGEIISLRIAIWDSTDGVLDSTALIDGFEWVTTPSGVANVVDGQPIPGGAGGSPFGQGGSGGQAGDTSLFGAGGTGGENVFGGSSGAGGSGTAAGTGGTGSLSTGACSDGSCAGPGLCCADEATSTCGTLIMGIFCQ